MQNEIKKYQVQHPLLKRYIKFFWEIYCEHIELNHKLIPLRNIDLKFNLSDTPHYLYVNGNENLLENVFFSGIQDNFRNIHLKISGKAHMLGICFLPDGFFPFLRIPLNEFKNQMLGADEVGFKRSARIIERLKAASDIKTRLNILENELVLLLNPNNQIPKDFREIFNVINKGDNTFQISEFCQQNNISIRKMERMFNKYIGVSAKTYVTINRFQNSLSQLLYTGYSKLSDIAYGNGYFDQMHFIKDFKRFAGNTPNKFVYQNDSILQVGKFT